MKRIGILILVVYLLGMGTTVSHAQQGGAITFAAGATSVTLGNQYVAAGGVTQYSVRALAGQVMTVTISNAPPNLALAIYGNSDGTPLVRADSGVYTWTGTLPRNQQYVIQVFNRGGAANFELFVSIPARLSFARGAMAAAVSGTIGAKQTMSYVLGVAQGQTITAQVTTGQSNVVLRAYGVDGTEYLQPLAYQTTWTLQLPKTQDYIIDIINLNGFAVNYTFTVQIPPRTSVPTPSRIQFARGAVSARVQGYVQQGGYNEYVLGARGGQTMTVTITSPYTTVGLTIVGADGSPLKRYQNGLVNSWSGVLPATQDYYIEAISLGASTSYVLDVTIVN